MHQISFPAFAKQQAERDADFLDCASLPDYTTAESLPAPVVVGQGVRTLRDIRNDAVTQIVVDRWVDGGCIGELDRWAVVQHSADGPRVYKFTSRGRVSRCVDWPGMVESLHRLQVAA